jgi:hypothetical protein
MGHRRCRGAWGHLWGREGRPPEPRKATVATVVLGEVGGGVMVASPFANSGNGSPYDPAAMLSPAAGTAGTAAGTPLYMVSVFKSPFKI